MLYPQIKAPKRLLLERTRSLCDCRFSNPCGEKWFRPFAFSPLWKYSFSKTRVATHPATVTGQWATVDGNTSIRCVFKSDLATIRGSAPGEESGVGNQQRVSTA